MTEQCIVSDWFANRSKLNIQAFIVDGIPFEIMALTDDVKVLIEACETHKEMVNLASNEGLSSRRSRIMDNEEYAKDIELFWADKFKDDDSDPCIRSRLGEKICEISGLSDVLDRQLEIEKAAAEVAAEVAAEEEAAKLKINAIDGDKLNELPEDLVIDGMNDADNLSQESLDEPDTVIYAN